MGFFDALRRALPGGSPTGPSSREVEARFLGVNPDTLPIAEETPFQAAEYDRAQWAKKLKRVVAGLPETRPEWDDVVTEARAMGFEPEWIVLRCRDEFTQMVRRAVADRVVTEAEHRRLDLARELLGIPDEAAVAILETVVAEAESIFGGMVNGV